MLERIKAFFVTWFLILLLNQIFIFHTCFKPYCILAALPHTGIIAFIIMAIVARAEKEESKKRSKKKGKNFTKQTKKRRKFKNFVKKSLEEKRGGTIIDIDSIKETVDLIHFDEKDRSINLIHCTPYKVADLVSMQASIERFDIEGAVGTHIDTNAHTVHKTLYLGAEKNKTIEQLYTLEKIKSDIYRYNDLKIVLLESGG